ncbi:MAG: hypothetical protein MZU91_15055 [Desulfosudis oleivorans]|nr:hypothetical protein [Desulfosudis oleivorans]
MSMMEGRKLMLRARLQRPAPEGRRRGLQRHAKGARKRWPASCSMHANKRERIEEAGAGDIVGVAGLKDSLHRRHPLHESNTRSCSSRSSPTSRSSAIAIEPKTHSRPGARWTRCSRSSPRRTRP